LFARYGPGGDAPVYEQHDPSSVDSGSARVAHLQYNTPIGLYSKTNALDALQGQTKGKPGDGTLQYVNHVLFLFNAGQIFMVILNGYQIQAFFF